MKYIVYLVLALVFIGCNQEDKLEAYYYPLNEMEKGYVYEYESVNDQQQPPDFWLYFTKKKGDEVLFNAHYYDVTLSKKQEVVERVANNKMEAVSYRLFDQDSTGKKYQSTAKIEANSVYPLGDPKSAKILKFQLEWKDPLHSNITSSLLRGRAFRQFTSYNFQGKEIPCAEFLMVETIEVEVDGDGVQEVEMETKELFARGIGLVYFNKKIGEQLTREYRLKERYTLADFKLDTGLEVEL